MSVPRSWKLAASFAVVGATVVAAPLGSATPAAAPYIHLNVTQARDSSGRTIASVWLDTNGNQQAGIDYWPLVYTQPWHSTCQADPRHPLPGGKTQVIFLPTFRGSQIVRLQTVVKIPTVRAQQLTLCGYLVSIGDPPNPGVVAARTTLSVQVQPPRGRNPMPLNQGPWRSCAVHNAPQVVRILANRGLAHGCGQATTIANTWVNQWHENHSQWVMWDNGPSYYPTVALTYSPIPALHRTLSCQATKVLPIGDFQPEVVNCGLTTFKFDPGL